MKARVLPIASIILLIAAVYFYIKARRYEFIDNLGSFITISIVLLMGLGIYYILQRQGNQYAHISSRLGISSIIFVLILLISFEFYKPTFTLADAEVKIADYYSVKVITEESGKISYNTDSFALHTDCYLIIGKEGKKENRYLFYPYSGEMTKINSEQE
ncbi:hypothetical protein ACQKM9_16885 [Viridibacillus sp. NPDC093762]|uniref:hypothetical protein n=1 Tax=Viridibacillus sp. NPDC093762 TaxID=3390720 RepID=UPI003CFE743B